MAKGADQNQDTRSRIIKWCKGIKLQNQFEPLASCSEDVRTSASTLNLPGVLSPHLSKGGALCKFQSSSIKRLALPHYKAGEIIGTRGENVKWIESHSGARVLVSHTRDVDLIGTPEQIRRAEQFIKDFFVEDTNATFYKSIADDMNHNSAYCDTEKFILVDGFKVKLKYYDLYRAITATYGDLRRPSVLDASEMAVVWIISDILSIVHAMSQVSLLNLTVDFLDDWNKKICLAEHFNYNVAWLRDHFEEIQTEFDRKNIIDAGLIELSSHSKVKLKDVESIEAMIAFLTSRLETAKASPSLKDVLAQTTIKKQEDHTVGDRSSNYFASGSKLLSQDTLDSYSMELKNISMTILEAMEKALKTEANEITKLFQDGTQTMRMNYYPACPQPDKVIGITPHSDGGGLTILLQLNEIEGLQIRKDGMWIPITPLQNAFKVNIGDILEIITNGIYPSIEHRATINKVKERLSIATFYNPKFDVEMGPVKSLVTANTPALFRRIFVKEYFEGLFSRALRGKSYRDAMRIENEDGI